MMKASIFASICVCTILLITGCAQGNKEREMSSATKLLGVVPDKDKYWDPGITAAEQKQEAQALALVVMYLANGNGSKQFVAPMGDPDNFAATDRVLVQLYKADPTHVVYKSVRDYIVNSQNQPKFAKLEADFHDLFKGLSSAVISRGGPQNPYPDNICPTNATVCVGAAGLSTACDIIP